MVRPATDEEHAKWEAQAAEAIREREVDSLEDAVETIWNAHLVDFEEPE